jgi:REP element-mobilizing transposase RayT
MSNPIPLQHDTIYHIYNRGNDGADLFIEERNYRYFLQLYIRHVHPVVETYAYCLLRNHFHLLIKVKSENEVPKPPSQTFSNLFNAYAKAINKAYGRTGALFERPFQRVAVTNEAYFARLVTVIHFNPVRHGFVGHPGEWLFSSYDALCSTRPTRLQRDVVLDWFGDREGFLSGHEDVDEDVDLVSENLTGLERRQSYDGDATRAGE